MTDQQNEASGVLAVVDDLMFLSKIDGLAAANGVVCTRAKNAADLEAILATSPRALAFVDLGLRTMDPLQIIARIKKQPGWEKTAVLAFGAHVDGARLEAAKAAGSNGAMPNSQFTRVLPDLIKATRGEKG